LNLEESAVEIAQLLGIPSKLFVISVLSRLRIGTRLQDLRERFVGFHDWTRLLTVLVLKRLVRRVYEYPQPRAYLWGALDQQPSEMELSLVPVLSALTDRERVFLEYLIEQFGTASSSSQSASLNTSVATSLAHVDALCTEFEMSYDQIAELLRRMGFTLISK
jgi:hypothetical protein